MDKDQPAFWPDGKPGHPRTGTTSAQGPLPAAPIPEERIHYRKNAASDPLAEAAATAPQTPAAASLEPAIHAACRAQGLVSDDFVAALSHHGSWLVHFTAGEHRQRIVWNGREGRLVLQQALRSGGWEDLRDCPVTTRDAAGFAAGIAGLLDAGPPGGR